MRIIYDIVLYIFSSGIGIAAFFGNRKAQLWINGRKNWEEKIKRSLLHAGKKRIWFHCASLGEFEQGRPLIDKLKLNDPSLVIILSFFSPSGYEIRKDYPNADLVCYLPVDTRKNAEIFLDLVSPSYIVFIKYEFWLHYFEAINRRNIPLFLVSVLFRPSQIFFKWYGIFFRKILNNINHFFVQDVNSAKLLEKLGFFNSTVAGDTRFDRVYAITLAPKEISILEKFKKQNKLLIAGSTWSEDEEVYLPSLKVLESHNFKFVIAPHEVNEKRLDQIIKNVTKYFNSSEIIFYSSENVPENAKVLIIDNIGILSSVYRYGSIAWIGGGFGKGIHNILEAAAFKLPVVFGPEYKKFKEAVELIELKGAFSVNNINEAKQIFTSLASNEYYNNLNSNASAYVTSKLGATDKILSQFSKILNDLSNP